MRSIVTALLIFSFVMLSFPGIATGLEYRPTHPSHVLPESETSPSTETDADWLSAVKKAWAETSNLSPLACILLLLPVTLCFICCNCVICICVKFCSKSRNRRRDSSNLSRTDLKSRDGNLDPIPLTGLVHANKTQLGFHPLRPVVGRTTSST